MKETVTIKSNPHGLIVILDKDKPFEALLKDIAQKFKSSSSFFKNAKMAISFEGRELTKEQEMQIVETITDNSRINILCIVDSDELHEEIFKKKIEEKLEEDSMKDGRFYKGTLRSGQLLESDTSIIILGDVNPGASVISKGNVVVLGSLNGTVYAGGGGNIDSFVVALYMNPVQIRIGDVIARSPDKPKPSTGLKPKIAFVDEGYIYMETITKDVLDDIHL